MNRARALIAPIGSTGNNTHQSCSLHTGSQSLMFDFKIEAIGAGPTITFKFQGSIDGDVSDAVAEWFDIPVKDMSVASTEVMTATKTAVGTYAYSFNREFNPISKVRLVTSANTNVTYSARVMLDGSVTG